MRASRFLTKTLRQDPGEAETVSHRLMLRAGMMQQVAAGVYTYLPLALRALHRIERIVREEMDAAGGQEVRMPTLQPIETWAETGRDAAFGANLFHLHDRRERELVLAPTHEEVVTAIARASVESYRDLPRTIYQIQTKFRDEPRPRAGLMRGREFEMKDAYSFHAGAEDLHATYQRMREAYRAIFRRCGLPTLEVEADSGAIGGKDSHEFIMPAESGEDTVLLCPATGYAANVERAMSIPPRAPEPQAEAMELVATPGIKTIEELCGFLSIQPVQTLKAVFYNADGAIVLATIRGDLEVNEVKLKNLLHVRELRLATPEESVAAGLAPGSTSPVGLSGVRRIGDGSITQGANFVAGANRDGYHYQNVNYPRDFQVDEVADIATAQAGHTAPGGGGVLEAQRGIEVGHVFKLGTFFSERIGAVFTDEAGAQRPMIMGCYGIGVSRVLAAAIEQNHDDKGIIFPAPIAPFSVHLVALNADQPAVAEAAEALYAALGAAGHDVLYDDRVESAGVKFNDADLLGLPVRVVVSPRNLKSGVVELRRRRDGATEQAPAADAPAAVAAMLALDSL
ncbi:MAG: proline--tRNA ligase [Chloroflexota bacterium]